MEAGSSMTKFCEVWGLKRLGDNIKIEVFISYIVRTVLIISVLEDLLRGKNFSALIGFVTVLLTYIPYIIYISSRLLLPASYKISITLFVFCANYLGNLNSFYDIIWWWDWALHFFSGLLLGFSGLIIIYSSSRGKNAGASVTPAFAAMFMFVFGVASGAVWEIFEFAMDSFFNLNMQLGSLVDTMSDIIADTAGSIAVSVAGYSYVRHNTSGIIRNILNEFFRLNQGTFQAEDLMRHRA